MAQPRHPQDRRLGAGSPHPIVVASRIAARPFSETAGPDSANALGYDDRGAQHAGVTGVSQSHLQRAARFALGGALLTTGIGHLTFLRKDFRAQVPDWVPLSVDTTVVYSGAAEIAVGTALLLFDADQQPALGRFTAAFFAAVFPGNLSQWWHRRDAFGLDTDTKRFARLFFQPLLIYWALKSTERRSARV
jgi:uncharacterized membrane protein